MDELEKENNLINCEQYEYSSERLLQLSEDYKEEYRQEKKKLCDKIREIYHNYGGNIGHRFMKVFLKGEHISHLKATIH